MKSSIKVDYASIYESDFGDKEPLVRVDLQSSDDPRDTLLNCLFTPTTYFDVRLRNNAPSSQTYVVYAKNKFAHVCDLASNVFNVMVHLLTDSTNLIMVTSNEEIYFEKSAEVAINVKRSKGVSREAMNMYEDREIYKHLVNDFSEFLMKSKDLSASTKQTRKTITL